MSFVSLCSFQKRKYLSKNIIFSARNECIETGRIPTLEIFGEKTFGIGWVIYVKCKNLGMKRKLWMNVFLLFSNEKIEMPSCHKSRTTISLRNFSYFYKFYWDTKRLIWLSLESELGKGIDGGRCTIGSL